MMQAADQPGASVTYVTQSSTNSSLTSYTYTGISIGDAYPGRVIIVCAIGNSNSGATFSNMSVNGVTLTNAAAYRAHGIAAVYDSTSTTIDVTLNYSVAPGRAGAWIYVGSGFKSLTPYSTASVDMTASNTNFSLNANVIPGAAAVATGYGNNSGAFTWTGVTEDFDSYTTGGQFSSASQSFSQLEAPRTIQVQKSSINANNDVALLAVFR